MENNNQPKPPNKNTPKFNTFWIYGVIALFLLALNFYTMANSSNDQITWNRIEEMIQDRAIEKLVIINQKFAHIYIKEELLSDPKYSDAAKNSIAGDSYHYWLEIGSVDAFANTLKDAQETANVSRDDFIYPSYESKQN